MGIVQRVYGSQRGSPCLKALSRADAHRQRLSLHSPTYTEPRSRPVQRRRVGACRLCLRRLPPPCRMAQLSQSCVRHLRPRTGPHLTRTCRRAPARARRVPPMQARHIIPHARRSSDATLKMASCLPQVHAETDEQASRLNTMRDGGRAAVTPLTGDFPDREALGGPMPQICRAWSLYAQPLRNRPQNGSQCPTGHVSHSPA